MKNIITFVLYNLIFISFLFGQSKDGLFNEKGYLNEGKYVFDNSATEKQIIESKSNFKANGTIKWSEGFEGALFPPAGWTVYNISPNSTETWSLYNTSPIFGKNSASVRYEAGLPVPANEDWLVTPKFDVKRGDVFSFWAKGATYFFYDSLEILYSENNLPPPAQYYKISSLSTSVLNFYRIPLDFLAGKNVCLAFHYKEKNQYRVVLDSVFVESTIQSDVAVTSIDIDRDLAAGIVKPKVVLQNFGYAETPFSVKLTITPGNYTSTKLVTALLQYTKMQVTFDDWNAAPGKYTVKATCQLSDDSNSLNDTLSKSVSVSNVLFNNGSFVNFPFSGENGINGSIVQAPLTALGFNHSYDFNCRVAEDFTIPIDTSWKIDNITFYAYQTGSSALVSPFISLNYRIWNGFPGARGSVVVFGDTITNKLASSIWTEAYRYTENYFTTSRPVFANTAKAGVTLAAGSYWIDWAVSGFPFADSWVPPVTIVGKNVTGNSWQRVFNVWSPIVDSVANVKGSFAQGLPFRIKGTAFGPIIPVELSSFSASVNNNKVLLNWTTSTETNNFGFIIERKINGSDFKEIAFVPGSGSTTSIKNYSFTDESVSSGIHCYRLKQKDFDGSIKYSNEVEIEINLPAQFSLLQNYPNPFNPSTGIKFSLAQSATVLLNVYNVLGQKVAELVNKNLEKGKYEISFDASKLSSGIYFYSINAKSSDGAVFSSVKKMILAR